MLPSIAGSAWRVDSRRAVSRIEQTRSYCCMGQHAPSTMSRDYRAGAYQVCALSPFAKSYEGWNSGILLMRATAQTQLSQPLRRSHRSVGSGRKRIYGGNGSLVNLVESAIPPSLRERGLSDRIRLKMHDFLASETSCLAPHSASGTPLWRPSCFCPVSPALETSAGPVGNCHRENSRFFFLVGTLKNHPNSA